MSLCLHPQSLRPRLAHPDSVVQSVSVEMGGDAPSGSGVLEAPVTRTFGELLIDLEEAPAAKAVIWGC
jgi:hypothetical protein